MSKSPTSWTFRWRGGRSLVRGLQLDPKLELWQSDAASERSRELLADCVFYARLRESPVETYTATCESDRSGLQTVAAQTVLTFSPQWNLE